MLPIKQEIGIWSFRCPQVLFALTEQFVFCVFAWGQAGVRKYHLRVAVNDVSGSVLGT